MSGRRTPEIGLPEGVITEESVGMPAETNSEIVYERMSGHELGIKVDSTRDGFLVFNETFDAGWSSTIDGKPVDIIRANIVCQGVLVPAGRHDVRFIYRPQGILLGAGALLIAILLLTGVYVATFRSDRT